LDSDVRHLEVDLPDDVGIPDRARFNVDNHFYRYHISHPEEARARLRVLCHHCNIVLTVKLGMERARQTGKIIDRPVTEIDKEDSLTYYVIIYLKNK
jgi:hypothetical protein